MPHPRHRSSKVLCALLVTLLVFATAAHPLRVEAAAVTHVTATPTTLSLLVGGTATVVATVHPAHAVDRLVNWGSNNVGVATVNSTGVVTGQAPGLAIITATTRDGAHTASVAVSVATQPVRVTGVTLNAANLNLVVGATWSIGATVSPANASNPAVVWSSSNAAVASVNVHGLVTAVAPGLAIITVRTQDGNFTAQVVVEVAALFIPPTGVNITPATLNLAIGASGTLSALVLPHNATNRSVVWASLTPLVAQVSATGVVTAIAPGVASIVARTQDGTQEDTATVTVPVPAIPVTGITTPPGVVAMTTGTTRTITATILPANATIRLVRWASNNPFVATVNATGVVTPVAPGTAHISVTTLDGGFVAWVEVQVSMPVVPVTGVTMAPTTLSLVAGHTGGLAATVAPANATNRLVTWASSNTQVALVDANGVVFAIAPGTATITARTTDGGRTATAAVTVTAPVVLVTGVTIAPATLSLVTGQTGTLAATVAPANATNRLVTWASSNTQVATVNDSGVVTARAPGTATITARTTDGGRTATAAVTVASPVVVVTGVTIAPTTLSLVAGQTGTLVATVAPANATNRTVTWASGNTQVATVNASGVVTAVAPGLTTITVTTSDGGRSASTAVSVAPRPILATGVALLPANLQLARGQVGHLVATVLPENAANRAVSFASSNASVATVDERGAVTALALGTATITVTTAEGGHTAESRVVVGPPRVETNIAVDTVTALSLPDYADVLVPAGAISGVNARLIAEVVPPLEAAPLLAAASRANLVPASEIVQLTLSGGTVNRAVHLAQRFTAAAMAAGQLPAIHVYNPRTARWVYLGGTVTDRVVTVPLDAFGQFAVFATRGAPALPDMAGHWAEVPVRTLAGMHIVGGHRDGNFRPDAVISRAEFVAMLTRALGLPENARAAERFRDAATFSWAAGAIGAAAEAGLVGGNADGTFSPERRITRAELAVIMSRVVQQGLVTVPRVPSVNFADQQSIPAWAQGGVRIAAEAGLVQGSGDGRFNPHNLATRAEVATMLYRLVAAK
ncbi:MAG: Ig-like domain-containing protein [Firmicutes bacterium]|nr:Ig-like domain-containing protein [Dethiobacter sp.]MBS3888780.1 Ig-like domain-containing protein [Bacillota bacterium]